MFLGIIFEKIRFHSKPIVLSYTEHNITINGVTNLKIFGDVNTTNNGSIPSINPLFPIAVKISDSLGTQTSKIIILETYHSFSYYTRKLSYDCNIN